MKKVQRTVFSALRRSQRGFTFIEVLAALLLFTVLVMPLYFQLRQGLAGQESQDRHFRMLLLAKGQLELLRGRYETDRRLIPLEIIHGNNQGEEDGFHWQLDWQLLESSQGRGLYQVEITYYRLREGRPTEQVTLSTRLMGEVP